MKTHVYANGLEIACKAASTDGVSPQAFPDPCWSPPPPNGGPVVIPYPNTCYAESITNGTKTVFIAGKEVAIEDQSYFGTSTGNEPATQQFAKGVATHVITGKAYFTQWSFDVLFESLGVPRHTDLVSHNHGSMPSNTPVFPYLSRSALGGHPCKDEETRIKRACEKEDDHSDARKGIRKKSKALGLLKKKGKHDSGGKDWHWTDDHCDGLQVNLNSVEKAQEYAKQMKEAYEQLPEMLNVMSALESELVSMATKAGGEALAKWGAKAGLKQVGGSSLPAIGNTIMGIWSGVDAVMAIGDVGEIRRVAKDALSQLEVLKAKASDLQSMAKRFKDIDKLSGEETLKVAAEGQDLLATLNECTRARKCNLVPKSQNDRTRGVETADGKGCCPGQTGHHLIYGAMMADADCPGYKYETAPTVCTEGFSQHHGSHGRVHDAMDKEVGTLARNGKLQNGTMSMDQALDAAAKSHAEAFPLSRCSKDCIRAQLESYYKCPGARPKAVDKNGGAVTPSAGTNE